MSEATLAAALVAELQAVSVFSADDVTDNDWSVLDSSVLEAPFAIVEVADTFVSRRDVTTAETSYEIGVRIFERFIDWDTTAVALRATRDAILTYFNAVGDSRAFSQTGAIDVTEIRSGSPIEPYYDRYQDADEEQESLPIFLSQLIIFEVQEY